MSTYEKAKCICRAVFSVGCPEGSEVLVRIRVIEQGRRCYESRKDRYLVIGRKGRLQKHT